MTEYTRKSECYANILLGSMLFFMFVLIQLALWNLLPQMPFTISIPAYAGLAPVSQGDLMNVTVITGYGAIWGIRMVADALEGLIKLSNKNLTHMVDADI